MDSVILPVLAKVGSFEEARLFKSVAREDETPDPPAILPPLSTSWRVGSIVGASNATILGTSVGDFTLRAGYVEYSKTLGEEPRTLFVSTGSVISAASLPDVYLHFYIPEDAAEWYFEGQVYFGLADDVGNTLETLWVTVSGGPLSPGFREVQLTPSPGALEFDATKFYMRFSSVELGSHFGFTPADIVVV